MKRTFIVILILNISFLLISEGLDISKIEFSGLNIKLLLNEANYESSTYYNIAYSSILPADAIYLVEDTVTGKEAIIQISPISIDSPPYTIYLTDEQFQFFTSTYEKNVDFLRLNLRFLGWNKKENNYSKLPNIITPDKSYEQILKNNNDSSYIQIGSFSHYQNGYSLINDFLYILSLSPNFYVIKSKVNDKYVYKILVGPYSEKDALSIMINNNLKDRNIFIKNYNSVIKDIKSSIEESVE